VRGLKGKQLNAFVFISALRQLGEPLVRRSHKNGLSVVGKQAVAFSLFVELNCWDVEGRLKLPKGLWANSPLKNIRPFSVS
jgi:hypothetical protein